MLLALSALGGPSAMAEVQPVAAVLSSEAGPYREALAGFQAGFGSPVPTFVLTREKANIPSGTQVVVAFGAKAALGNYQDQPTVIYAMAPGAGSFAQTVIVVRMELGAARLLGEIKKVYPGLKRLGILWRVPRLTEYVKELRQVGGPVGVTIEGGLLADNTEAPDRLRSLYGRVDAIWLPPDPLLLNADSLSVFVGFARANKVPLFVPTGGLVDQGAVASIGPTFREMGRLAGVAARKVIAGEAQESPIYPDRAEIIINKAAAAEIGLGIPEETLRGADRVLP